MPVSTHRLSLTEDQATRFLTVYNELRDLAQTLGGPSVEANQFWMPQDETKFPTYFKNSKVQQLMHYLWGFCDALMDRLYSADIVRLAQRKPLRHAAAAYYRRVENLEWTTLEDAVRTAHVQVDLVRGEHRYALPASRVSKHVTHGVEQTDEVIKMVLELHSYDPTGKHALANNITGVPVQIVLTTKDTMYSDWIELPEHDDA